MCYFITELLPDTFDPDVYNTCFAPLKRILHKIENQSILTQAGPGYRCYYGTTEMCDCNSTLGSWREGESLGDRLEREVGKLRQRKWSDHKIEAWLRESKRAKRVRKSEEEARQWIECIKCYLAATSGKRLGLLLHYYSGMLEEEEIALKGIEEVDIDALTIERLLKMKVDTLYWFIGDRKQRS